jgi:hypothetical protein
MAIIASLFKDSRWFGTVMGLVESTMSLGSCVFCVFCLFQLFSAVVLHEVIHITSYRHGLELRPVCLETLTHTHLQVGGGARVRGCPGPVWVWSPLLRHQPAGPGLHANRVAVPAT